MKHIKLYEELVNENSRLNDYKASELIGKQIKFPNGTLKYMFVRWKGDYKSVEHDDIKVSPDETFTVKNEEKIYYGSRGEKSTSKMILITDKRGNDYYIGARMAYEPIEIVS